VRAEVELQGEHADDVLEAAGRHDDAADVYRGALECYERKQIIPLVRQIKERLGALER
jgi:hypothetical protein